MSDNPLKYSIPTWYNGVHFRSKLEADWATFFDRHRIVYAFEPEGFQFDGIFFLPDFWLPELKTIVEVKGVFDDSDTAKLDGLWEATRPPAEKWYAPQLLIVIAGAPVGERFTVYQGMPLCWGNASLSQCRQCGRWWFYDSAGGWYCRGCGAYNGDHHIRETHTTVRDCPICQGERDTWFPGCDEVQDWRVDCPDSISQLF